MDSWKSGTFFGATSVMLGAFGAHALKSFLKADIEAARKLGSWDTAIKYQMIHSLALLAFSLKNPNSKFSYTSPGFLFTSGILLFSGSIYVLILMPARWTMMKKLIGPVTPIGGFLLIGGWIAMFNTL